LLGGFTGKTTKTDCRVNRKKGAMAIDVLATTIRKEEKKS